MQTNKKEEMIKLKVKTDFDSAHRLVGYKGKCNNLHGHMWVIKVEIEGKKKDINEIGMLWDFINLKKVRESFDHKTILKDCKENRDLIVYLRKTRFGSEDNVYLMKKNPTAENLCYEVFNILKEGGELILNLKIRVYETPTSYAEIEKTIHPIIKTKFKPFVDEEVKKLE